MERNDARSSEDRGLVLNLYRFERKQSVRFALRWTVQCQVGLQTLLGFAKVFDFV